MKERKNVTYLLGAGASANALPTIKEFKFRLKLFVKYLRHNFTEKNFIEDFDENFIDNTFEFYLSPDTYAKYLFLIEKVNLTCNEYNDNLHNDLVVYKKYKLFLSCFFIFEMYGFKSINLNKFSESLFKEFIVSYYKFTGDKIHDIYDSYINKLNLYLDPRYNSLILTIFNNLSYNSLPENINILSWNYDNQFELAIDGFSKREVNEVKGLIKLNGTFEIKKINEENEKGYINFYDILFDNKADIIEELYNILSRPNEYVSELSFAWEPKNEHKIEASKKIIKESDSIVIIGYSFPNFNRFIDRELFSEVDLEKTKIYLQDMNAENIIKKLSGVKRGMEKVAEPYTEISEFLIPNEFWEEKDV